MARPDPHSYADDTQPSAEALELDLTVDFEARVLTGTATLHLDRAADGALDLDTRGLRISAVSDEHGEVDYELHAPEGFMGQRLTARTRGRRLTLRYATAPEATALQWLEPAQTQGGVHPYMFTQCQAIHARSIVPCQDSPRVRQTVKATLRVPATLRAVMAAADVDRTESDGTATHRFDMPQRIPSYLLAFAVGDLASQDVGPRSRVWAEPAQLEAAAWEFAGVDRMLEAAEGLFGAYPWDRFDLLVMPPSFPYGGMENPRLTFLTPTLLAKDRSLVNVVAHELAHSWTGNLVTNASIDHFWLNEGFTVYAERRILEALEGKEACALHAAIGRRGLERDVARLEKKDPAFTQLENDLRGVDPDEVYSQVPYEKGYLFVRRLEEAVGRDAFDAFLAKYIARFAFTSITTAQLEAFLQESLPEAVSAVDVDTWLRSPGIPADAPRADSARLDRLDALARGFEGDAHPPAAELEALDATEWQVLLSALPPTLPPKTCAWLDETFSLTEQTNYEILVEWLALAARSGHDAVWPKVKATLLEVGRGKYLRPLYGALVEAGPEGRAFAEAIFAEARGRYHPLGQQLVQSVLAS